MVMFKRSIQGGLILALTVFLFSACGSNEEPAAASEQKTKMNHYAEAMKLQDRRDLLEKFMEQRMTGPYGIYTNYLDSEQNAEAATGHEVLSESAGLLLRYEVRRGERGPFDQTLALATKTFDQSSGFSYRYSPKLDQRYPVNAAIDDLRIIQAMYEAANTFKEEAYRKEADVKGQRLYQYNVKDGYLYDFYDENLKTVNSFITLCYVNLSVLEQIPAEAGAKKELLKNMRTIVTNGYLSNDFPFYQTRYNYSTGSYESSDSINTVESLLTILALAEAGLQKPESIAFIKDKVQSGTLYGSYSRSGQPRNEVQSTAIYAICAIIGSRISDQDLYRDSIKRMQAYQVWDSSSMLNGGFADQASQQAYSFDNLMALLAYAY
ncbi:hypothetical protein Q5741_16700 [Paenibacillus sp. JX-17]|uniref:Glycosyl hydrolase n=2 Tax=Paenibacillus lacisoli TaxID=3064525 RepID=A0ABT9CFJ9_9BACL|nr:hypothetical protein [Paenibacillus sp. JX-17]